MAIPFKVSSCGYLEKGTQVAFGQVKQHFALSWKAETKYNVAQRRCLSSGEAISKQ